MNTFDKHMDAIRRGKLTRSNVIGVRKAINHAERIRNGWSGWSGNRSSLTPEQADRLEAAIEAAQPTIVGDLHESGLKVLRNKRYTKRLNEASAIIAGIVRFNLVRFDRIGRRGEFAVPVYRATSADGRAVTFRNVPWQSGGDGPELF